MINSTKRSDILVFNCYLCHVRYLLTCYVYSTKIGEISDISKCFENFVSQALGVLTRIYAAELREIKKKATEIGAIDQSIVDLLEQEILADQQVSLEEANFLFALKKQFSTHRNSPNWQTFFVHSITRYLLEDEDSPGVVDDREAQWLRAHLQSQGKLDAIDRLLLTELRTRSISFPTILNFKSRKTLLFEQFLYGTRFTTFLAVVGSLVASIVLFVKGTINIIRGVYYFATHVGSNQIDDHHLVAEFVSAIDIFLFSTVLFIFALGIYELFINKIDIVNRNKEDRPGWLVVKSIDDLKTSLGKVILMILIVSFFEHSLSMKYDSILQLLYLGIGILLISAALYLTHKSSHH